MEVCTKTVVCTQVETRLKMFSVFKAAQKVNKKQKLPRGCSELERLKKNMTYVSNLQKQQLSYYVDAHIGMAQPKNILISIE